MTQPSQPTSPSTDIQPLDPYDYEGLGDVETADDPEAHREAAYWIDFRRRFGLRVDTP